MQTEIDPETKLEFTERLPLVFVPATSVPPADFALALDVLRVVIRRLKEMGQGETWAPFDASNDADITRAVADLHSVGLLRMAVAEAGGITYAIIRPSELAGQFFLWPAGE